MQDKQRCHPVLRPQAAAAYLGLSVVTLQRQRARGEGPRHLRLSERAVGYRREDLDRWLEERASPVTARRS